MQQLIPDSRVFDAERSARRLHYLEPYAEAARSWLRDEAEIVDITHLTPGQAAQQIVDAVRG